MGTLIGNLRDDFEDASVATAWTASASGSATAAETSGEARFTLPSSTAGSHVARYTSRSAYDLTGGSFSITIDTMVSTSVAATAFFQLYKDASNALQWIQLSGTLYARGVVAGVSTDHYSVAWNATTYKYLRMRTLSGDILWESSTNGSSWTTRATVAAGSLFAITDLYVDFGATCGNVASPGSFRLDEANLITLATNWRWQQALWPLSERVRNTTIAIDAAGTAQGYLVTADGVDVNGEPSGNVRYHSGPADGGRLLTEQATQAAAEAMAVNLPLDGRFDLASQIEGRCIRLYSRSIDGAAFTIREFYPRRLVQADDIEAESIRALHIASASITGDRIVAGTITADLITVTELSAITANMGTLTAGSITGGTIDGAVIYAGSGNEVTLDNSGIRMSARTIAEYSGASTAPNAVSWKIGSETIGSIEAYDDAGSTAILTIAANSASYLGKVSITSKTQSGLYIGNGSVQQISVQSPSTATVKSALINLDGEVNAFDSLAVDVGVNVGTATGAAAGQVRGSGYHTASGAGTLPTVGVLAMGYDTGTPRGLLVAIDNGTYKRLDIEAIDLRLKYQTTNRIQIDATGIGAFNVAPVGRQSIGAAAPAGGTGTAAGGWDTAANRNAAITLLNNIRTALINLGWCQT